MFICELSIENQNRVRKAVVKMLKKDGVKVTEEFIDNEIMTERIKNLPYEIQSVIK